MHVTRSSQRGAIVIILMALILVGFIGFALWTLGQAMNAKVDVPEAYRARPASASDGSLVQVWSIPMKPPLVYEMAPVPGQRGQFLALNAGEIHRFDAQGTRVGGFAAPPKTGRMAADPTGALPYLMVVSSKTKWTGAIDHVVTTDYFFHALDLSGREMWKKRFDPKEASELEPVAATFAGAPVVVLSASRKIFCFDATGTTLWELPFWHHPGSVTPVDFDGGGILAAEAPKKDIVRIGGDGKVLSAWAPGDGPRRFRTIRTRDGTFGISLRQVFRTGPGVPQALMFFDGEGRTIREVELPRDAGLLSYAPIPAMDVDGSGRLTWVVGLGDGTIFMYSPTGERLAHHTTGARLRNLLALPQVSGPDLLVAATETGLTAWRPVPDRIQPPR